MQPKIQFSSTMLLLYQREARLVAKASILPLHVLKNALNDALGLVAFELPRSGALQNAKCHLSEGVNKTLFSPDTEQLFVLLLNVPQLGDQVELKLRYLIKIATECDSAGTAADSEPRVLPKKIMIIRYAVRNIFRTLQRNRWTCHLHGCWEHVRDISTRCLLLWSRE